MTEEEYKPPIRCAAIAALLRLIARGLEPIELQHWQAGYSSLVMTGSGWWVTLQAGPDGEVVGCSAARPPSVYVPLWTRGGERDDWTRGPESVVIDPVVMLTAEQREQLRVRLEGAPQPPPLWWCPYWDVADEDEEWLERPS